MKVKVNIYGYVKITTIMGDSLERKVHYFAEKVERDAMMQIDAAKGANGCAFYPFEYEEELEV